VLRRQYQRSDSSYRKRQTLLQGPANHSPLHISLAVQFWLSSNLFSRSQLSSGTFFTVSSLKVPQNTLRVWTPDPHFAEHCEIINSDERTERETQMRQGMPAWTCGIAFYLKTKTRTQSKERGTIIRLLTSLHCEANHWKSQSLDFSHSLSVSGFLSASHMSSG